MGGFLSLLTRSCSSPPVAGSLLDHIVSQAQTDLDVPIYSLADYRKGGLLVEAYKRGGSKEVEAVARKELPQYLYEGGAGTYKHLLQKNGLHNSKGKPNNNNEVSLSIDEEPLGESAKKQGLDRICWKLESRGLLGESLLHILIICNSSIHTRIAKVLLKIFPAISSDYIEGVEYRGASGLHLGIAYHNSDIVAKMVESGASVDQRATGTFFLPYDQQKDNPKKTSDFEGLCYLGEYPLSWAACCEDETSYNLLLSKGADPNSQDSFGNMILHMVVIQDKLKMYGYALRHPTKPARDRILNKYGLTPLTLACKLGRNQIFREMLELSALEFWRYSNITCSGYPLNALDTILPNGKTNWNSALMIILNGKTNEHLDMLDGGVIQRLLEEKWKTFARGQFLKRLALMFLHLIVLSIAVFLRPKVGEHLRRSTEVKDIVRYCAEIGTCLGCVGFVVFQQVQEIISQGLFGFLLNLSSNPTKAIFLVSNVMVLMCIPCRVWEDRVTEDLLLSLALPGSWFFLIFFAGAVRLTGPFVTMIYNMLVGDMFRFSIIYLIFLLAFTQAFYFLYKNQGGNDDGFGTYADTWMSLFHMTLGVYEYKELNKTFYPMLTQAVFAIFMILTPILLLNMLIAMMGNTYCEVITQSEREWMRQWAKIVVALERAISQKNAQDFMHTYSIKLPSSGNQEDPEKELRAVMVIKSKNKTKARQRKGALMNWKRFGKKIITELRQCGGSAEALRQKMQAAKAAAAAKPSRRCGDTFEDFEVDSPGGPSSRGDGLGKALNQLAFAHDWDFGGQPGEGEEEQPQSPTSKANFGDLLQQVAWAHDLDVNLDAPPITPTATSKTESEVKQESAAPENLSNGQLPSSSYIQRTEPLPAAPNGQLPQLREELVLQVQKLPIAEEIDRAQCADNFSQFGHVFPSPSTPPPPAPPSGRRERLHGTARQTMDEEELNDVTSEHKKKHKKKKCKKLRKSKVGIEEPTEDDQEVFESAKPRRRSSSKGHSKQEQHTLQTVDEQVEEIPKEGIANLAFSEGQKSGRTPEEETSSLAEDQEPLSVGQRTKIAKFGSRRVQAMSSLVAWEDPAE